MDIIAYGAASKEKRRAEELAALLGADVKGGKENLQERLDTLMDSMDDVTRLADRVIVRDAVNLMKAEARLNTVVQAKKYGMDHMVFDDLLDLSGIDTLKSTGYTHDAVKGEIHANSDTVIFTKANSEDRLSLLLTDVEIEEASVSPIIPNISEGTQGNVITHSFPTGTNIGVLFDGSYMNSISTNSGVKNVYVSVKMPSAKKISHFELTIGSAAFSLNCAPLNISLEYKVNGVWGVAKSYNNLKWSMGETKVFPFIKEGLFDEVRINMSGSSSSGANIHVNELQIYEYLTVKSESRELEIIKNNEVLKADQGKFVNVEIEPADEWYVGIPLKNGDILKHYGLIWT